MRQRGKKTSIEVQKQEKTDVAQCKVIPEFSIHNFDCAFKKKQKKLKNRYDLCPSRIYPPSMWV